MKTIRAQIVAFVAVVSALCARADSVSYLAPVFDTTGAVSGYETKLAECTKLPASSEALQLTSGWYCVEAVSAVSSSLVIAGDVHLVLKDSSRLTVNVREYSHGGLRVEVGNALTVYAQSTDNVMGELVASGGRYAAGIGSGSADGVESGRITINGGMIQATGGKYAAGIGGGSRGNGENITINGGMLTAAGGKYAAGIGGGAGADGENITINGGEVYATAGLDGAGIGGGSYSLISGASASNGCLRKLRISGGTVFAQGNGDGRDIGRGSYRYNERKSSDFVITGGSITTLGTHGIESTVTSKPKCFTVDGTDIIAGSGDGWTYNTTSGLLTLDSAKAYVLSGECTREDLDLGVMVSAAATVILSNATITTASERSPLTVGASGVTIRLAGTNTLTATALDGASALSAIAVPNGATVTIARDVAAGETANLIAVGGASAAAIGGEGDVTITSGVIEAQGGILGNNVTISGGTVSATGRKGGPDIGGTNVRITGGSVVAGKVTNPKNTGGASVYCVTVPDVRQQDPVSITSQTYLADTYGQTDLYPVFGALCLWLPSGTYDEFYVGEDTEPYYATVASEPTIAYRKRLALYVNGELVDGGEHEVWSYDDGELKLNGTTNSYVVVGESMNGDVRIVVDEYAYCDVTISGVRLGKDDLEEGENLITFGANSRVNLVLDGLTAFKTNDGIAPIRVCEGASVNICGEGTVFAWKIDIEENGRVTMQYPKTLSFATQASAEAAAKVIKPLADETDFPVIDQVAYGELFVVSAVQGASGKWTLDYQLSEETEDLIRQTLSSADVLSKLVESITAPEAVASVTIMPIPGIYYGLAGSTEVTEMNSDKACPPAWYAGQQDKDLTVKGTTFLDAVKAFYQLRATAKPW